MIGEVGARRTNTGCQAEARVDPPTVSPILYAHEREQGKGDLRTERVVRCDVDEGTEGTGRGIGKEEIAAGREVMVIDFKAASSRHSSFGAAWRSLSIRCGRPRFRFVAACTCACVYPCTCAHDVHVSAVGGLGGWILF